MRMEMRYREMELDGDGSNQETKIFPLNFRGLLCVNLATEVRERSSDLRDSDACKVRSLEFRWPQQGTEGIR